MSPEKIIYYTRLKLLQQFGSPILIWNMGKVGSTSIARSLWQHVGRRNVLTTHFMNDENHYRSQVIYNLLINDSTRPLPIITLTREPISKNISSFFQNFKRNTGIDPDRCSLSIDKLNDIFTRRFNEHEATINWFDNNLKKYINLDVYKHHFNINKGYKIIKHGRFTVLILRLESSNETKVSAVKELLGLSTFELIDENIGSKKEYSKLYNEFKGSVLLPKSYVDQMLNSQYSKYFYSIDEIDKLKKRWLK